MNAVKSITVLVFTIFICQMTTVDAQTAYTEIYPDKRVAIDFEKLNVSTYSNKYKGSILDYSYTKDDGTLVQVKSYKRGSNIEIFERPPLPYIHIIYKEFYPNGNLKQKGVLLPRQLKIGKWLDLDQNGEGLITDNETGRTAFGYNEVLTFLEERGYYNITDGSNWSCSFWYTPENRTWGVRVDKDGHQYKMYTFDSDGIDSITETDLSPSLNSVQPTGTFFQTE